MKLIIIRHGDPDYSIDSLTEAGWMEAEALSRMMVNVPADEYYVSPLGRARDTASLTMKRLGRDAVTLDWLREFNGTLEKPFPRGKSISWDWLPQDFVGEDKYFNDLEWFTTDIMKNSDTKQKYDYIVENFDSFLAEHGYVRCGRYYKAVRPNNDTVVFFCHFALECVLLSRLINISPMALWHGFCSAPTGVTTVVTEERREGVAYWRTLAFGDISHLYSAGLSPAFAARFRECYKNDWERLD